MSVSLNYMCNITKISNEDNCFNERTLKIEITIYIFNYLTFMVKNSTECFNRNILKHAIV